MRWPLCIFLIQIAVTTYAQKVLPITWQRCYGDARTEIGHEMIQTSDHGFLLSGVVASTEPVDANVFKLAADGSVEWQHAYGGSQKDVLLSVIESKDGFYYLTGTTASPTAPGHHGSYDVWVIKLQKNGDEVWQKCYGGPAEDAAQTIAEDMHGNILVACMTESEGGDVSGNHGKQDVWMLKLDPDGKILWQKCFGGSRTDGYYNFGEKGGVTLTPASDGGFAFAALTVSKDGDLEIRKDLDVDYDLWVVKIAEDDSTVWSSVIGGSLNEWPNAIIETRDSGFAIAGNFSSDLLLVDGLVVRLDKNGATKWQRSFGKKEADQFLSVVETDEGFMLAGTTYVDTIGQHFADEAWIVSVDPNGTLIDEKIFGGSSRDVASDIIRCENGAYRFIGHTFSEDGDLTGYHKTFETFADIWVAEFGVTSRVASSKAQLIAMFPNPTTGRSQTSLNLSAQSQLQYDLFDLSGNNMLSNGPNWYERGEQLLTVDLSAFPSGSYRYRLLIDGIPYTGTIQLVK